MAKRKTRVVDDSDDEETSTQSSTNTANSAPEPPAKKKKPSPLEAFQARFDVENKNNKEILSTLINCCDIVFQCSCSLFAAEQMKSWSATCYQHYRMPPNIIEDSDSRVKYQFVCKL